MKAQLHGKPDASVLTDLGVYFADHQQYDCAASAFATSLQTDPQQHDLPHVAFMFGVSLYLSGDAKEAIPALQTAEQLGYRDARLHVILATALGAAHSTADADAEWRLAIEFDPDSAVALDALSNDLVAANNYKAVIELLDKPRLGTHRTAQQAQNLGLAYDKSGKPEQAVLILQDAFNTNPDSLPIAHHLADVLTQLHRNDEAAMILKLAEANQQSAAQAGK